VNYETRLVVRFRQGEARAIEELFDLYADRALSLAVRLTETREDAEEVTQEAFLRAFRHARTFRGETHNITFGPWLFAIVRNVAAEKRRQLRLPTLSLEASGWEGQADREDVAAEAIRRWERERLLSALDSLPEEQRLVLTLCDLEDVSHAEAATVLGKSVAATKSLVYRARRALRDKLVELEAC
jgi:RNA polymerase sigma-70 factor (ECF subfamily)